MHTRQSLPLLLALLMFVWGGVTVVAGAIGLFGVNYDEHGIWAGLLLMVLGPAFAVFETLAWKRS